VKKKTKKAYSLPSEEKETLGQGDGSDCEGALFVLVQLVKDEN
jgi:hypothetical protein